MIAFIYPLNDVRGVVTFYSDGREGPEFYSGPNIRKALDSVRSELRGVWSCWVRVAPDARSRMVGL